ncbi:hypothetical protein GJ744_009654 [Endocarpon pusillum]|uniref:Uncharacterized protein n=1 Tax=Endocarpon pusillum TaxID=364733 RepID=A0A8H7AJF6_9EURO|nr:hypothetical protein GJ744_009654 [Endocarpon pusillum]
MIWSQAQDQLLPIEITCFFEELPLPGVGVVVPPHSAILPGYIPIGIRSNYMDMTKFENADDPGFKAVAGELRRWVRALAKSENARLLQTGSPHRDGTSTDGGEGTAGHQILQLTQGSSQFGPTTVSGGWVFQGNQVGGHSGIF